MCTENCKSWFHLIKSVVGTLFGFSAFVVFFCVYDNVDAGFWAFCSGVFACVCFHLHYLHMRHKLEAWHSPDTLNGVKVLAVLGAVVGVAGVCWYLFNALYFHIPLMPVKTSMYLAAVWSFLTATWSTALFLYCRGFINMLSSGHQPLISI